MDDLRKKLEALYSDPGPLGRAVAALLQFADTENAAGVVLNPEEGRAILRILASHEERGPRPLGGSPER